MSSLVSSHGAAAFATAVAVSGTFMFISFCRQKQLSAAVKFAAFDADCSSISPSLSPPPPHYGRLRPCISSEDRRREIAIANEKMKKKRRIRFAKEVIEFELDGKQNKFSSEEYEEDEEVEERRVVVRRSPTSVKEVQRNRRMPANRLSLYNGILQDRMQRMTGAY